MKKYVLLLGLGLLFACKKDVESPTPDPDPDPVESTDEELIRDSIYYYYNLYSYWTTNVPDYDVLRTFTESYDSYQGVLDALTVLTPTYNFKAYTYLDIDPGTHYDRYSFIQDNSSSTQLASSTGLRMDTNEGYGMYFSFIVTDIVNLKASLIIYFVEGGSPAQVSGITRGSLVTAINDDTNVQLSVVKNSDASYSISDRSAYNTLVNKLNDAIEANSLSLKVKGLDNIEKVHTLGYKTYNINPILANKVFKYSSKNIGYLAFSSFEETDQGTTNRSNFETIFKSFENAEGGAITDLILDMRYNTGGYVSTAEYLANKIIGAQHAGELMFTYDVNTYLQQYKTGADASFADTYFASDNSTLDLNNVYVLVSEQTASAAELLINVLKPYVNVVLIGETDRTYGKPVGFFEQSIMSKVSLWATSFKTINKNGDTDYWDGMTVPNIAYDDYERDFGDAEELMTAKALTMAGVTTSSSTNKSSVSRSTLTSSSSSKKTLGIKINKPEEKNMLKRKNEQ
ncbi:S41 family peptidase [Sphingobacterium sp. LRF_L2]|uniref:S41 family peptidase n=1 Tax=Sphingobacterium sp. LRF_L2 TaxID=3369421 RepID=UPI003F62450D